MDLDRGDALAPVQLVEGYEYLDEWEDLSVHGDSVSTDPEKSSSPTRRTESRAACDRVWRQVFLRYVLHWSPLRSVSLS